MLPIKKILFPSSFWGIFDFFVCFNNFGKKNKRMLRYNGGTSVIRIMILEKDPLGTKGVKTQKKTTTRLAYKVCKCG